MMKSEFEGAMRGVRSDDENAKSFARQATESCQGRGERSGRNGSIVLALFDGRIAQAEPMFHEVDVQHRLRGKGRATRPGRLCIRLHQAHQICPRHHQVHLIDKFTLADAFGGQIESGSGKALLFHAHLTSEHGHQMTCAELV